jgi:membrane-associated protein
MAAAGDARSVVGVLSEPVLDVIHEAMSSPWVYPALFVVAVVDAFFPVVPSESAVITAGVFAAAAGSPSLSIVIVAAAVGAFVGDHVSYQIGRSAGGRRLTRTAPGTRRRAAFDWAERTLAERGGLVLVVARYVPGGRTAITLTMGAVAYPRRRFALFDGVAAVSWAMYSGLVGYVGGAAFERDPLKGVLFGVGLAVATTVVIEAVRHLRKRTRERVGSG